MSNWATSFFDLDFRQANLLAKVRSNPS